MRKYRLKGFTGKVFHLFNCPIEVTESTPDSELIVTVENVN